MTQDTFVGPDGANYSLQNNANIGPVMVTRRVLICETAAGETFVFDRSEGTLPKSAEDWRSAGLVEAAAVRYAAAKGDR